MGNNSAARYFKIIKYLTLNIGRLNVFNTVDVLLYKTSQIQSRFYLSEGQGTEKDFFV